MTRMFTVAEIDAELARRAALGEVPAAPEQSLADVARDQAMRAARHADHEGTARAHATAVAAVAQAAAVGAGTATGPVAITFSTNVHPVPPRPGIDLPDE